MSDDGLTLIEVIVALFVLGIVFSAVAASLITFTRAASANERRVEATAALNQLHESFVLLSEDVGGNLADELDDPRLAALGISADGMFTDPLDGSVREIVIVEDTGCDSPCEGTERRAPRALGTDVEINGRLYDTVVQVVSWVDRSGDGEADTRRFTTWVEWTWLGRTYSERFDSERAPSSMERPASTQPRAVVVLNPSLLVLDDDGTPLDHEFVQANVFFTPVGTAAEFVSLAFPVLNAENEVVSETISLSPHLGTLGPMGHSRFTGDIAVSGRTFPLGQYPVTAEATNAEGTITGSTQISFVSSETTDTGGSNGGGSGDNGEDENLEPPSQNVEIITLNRAPGIVRYTGGSGFACTFEVSAFVKGMTDVDGAVTIRYPDGTAEGASAGMIAEEGTPIMPTGTWFEFSLVQGSSHHFPTTGNPQEFVVDFIVTAERDSDNQSVSNDIDGAFHRQGGDCVP